MAESPSPSPDRAPTDLRRANADGPVAVSLATGRWTDPAEAESNAGPEATEVRRWQRVRRGAYVDRQEWEGLAPDAQLLVRAHAVAATAETRRVFSHCTAARAWGLPTIGRQQDCVEVLVGDGRTGRSPGLIRRRTQNPPQAVRVGGLLVTSPARTAVDIARVQSLASGVSVMDSVLTRGLATREDLEAEVRSAPRGGRGRQQAALAVALADAGGESAGESLSRVQLYRAGFPRPRLQVEFSDAHGFVGRVDMFWEECRVVGEFDGKTKYGVDGSQSPAQAGEVLWREKRREDRLRALGLTVVRWIWDDAWVATPMLRRLREAGLSAGHLQEWPTSQLPSGVPTRRVAHE